MLPFGKRDTHIRKAEVDRVQAEHPEVQLF
jgi:hypothetical protein